MGRLAVSTKSSFFFLNKLTEIGYSMMTCYIHYNYFPLQTIQGWQLWACGNEPVVVVCTHKYCIHKIKLAELRGQVVVVYCTPRHNCSEQSNCNYRRCTQSGYHQQMRFLNYIHTVSNNCGNSCPISKPQIRCISLTNVRN